MSNALWVAKTGLDAQQTRLSVISNNLANVSTTGFKQTRAVFEDLLYQNVRQVGSQSSEDTRCQARCVLRRVCLSGMRIIEGFTSEIKASIANIHP